MSSKKLSLWLLLLLLLGSPAWSQSSQPTAGQEAAPQASLLPKAVLQELEKRLQEPGDPRLHQDALWRVALGTSGTIQPLLKELEVRLQAQPLATPRARKLIRLSARLRRRLGDLQEAGKLLARIPKEQASPADLLSQAEILDAEGRQKEAREAYRKLLQNPLPEELKSRVLLRQALLQKKGAQKGPSPLARFAEKKGRSLALRNQAAMILALTGEQKAAIKLFKVSGKGTKLFRQEVRLADWSLEAKEWQQAEDFAWKAVRAAHLKRDRRYALTLLVEAYRQASALGKLIERFGATPDLDDQSRQIWIDLLRETGRVDEALKLFKSSQGGAFTIDMRRELLEMCREVGRDEVLVTAYQKLIHEEPRFLEWREGLSRFYLEHGDQKKAEDVWRPYLKITSDTRYLLAAAGILGQLGLDDLATLFARTTMQHHPEAQDQALLFLFELEFERGRLKGAATILDELDRLAPPGDRVRKELGDGYARLGKKKRSVQILEGLRKVLRGDEGPDLDMKLAVMLSEIGNDGAALEHWKTLWRKTTSVSRRRYVEERMMTVASRLGKLASIAVELEKRLAAGKADDLDAGLLVRIYTRVKDPISATEVIQEHMQQKGVKQVEVLKEKARVFLSCDDYYDYEKSVSKLIKLDPEGRPDYLRELAMSKLERGQRGEARKILKQLKKEEPDSTSEEFEAGVLALAGLRDEALKAYRQGLAHHPERIDTYLLLSNVMKKLGRFDRSAGMFQDLALTAKKDDLFTIAIDGILNMRDGRQNLGAPERLVKWARRVVLERLARRPDKLYLYRLAADLSDELKDQKTSIRALKSALPVAGEQRGVMLRELMAMTRPHGNQGTSFVFVNGRLVQQNKQQDLDRQKLMFGRRLLGLGELVPPEVYMDMGKAFLEAHEVVNALKTFNQASKLPEFLELQPEIAQSFEQAGYPEEALRIYERSLTTKASDIPLITKVGEMHERLGHQKTALGLYRQGLKLYMQRQPLTTARKKSDHSGPRWYGRNVDTVEAFYQRLLSGLMATLPDNQVAGYLADRMKQIRPLLKPTPSADKKHKEQLSEHPRLNKLSALVRRLALSTGHLNLALTLDLALLKRFKDDKKLLGQLTQARLNWGFFAAARRLIQESPGQGREKQRLLLLAGGVEGDHLPAVVPPAEAARVLLPLLVAGKRKAAERLLERLDLSTGQKVKLDPMPVLTTGAAFLSNQELALTLCRHWFNLMVRHKTANLYTPTFRILQASSKILDRERRKSLLESMVNRVVENPDKFSSFLSRLPDLQKATGVSLLTPAQAEKVIRSRLQASDRFIYGIPQLFALLPEEQRSATLRSVWPLVPKNQRAYFLTQLVGGFEKKVSQASADFMVGAFSEALENASNLASFQYYIENLVDGHNANLEVAVRFIKALQKQIPQQGGSSLSLALALALRKQGQEKKAFVLARKAFKKLCGVSHPNYQVNNSIRRLIKAFGKPHGRELRAVVDQLEKENGKSATLWRRRLDLRQQSDDARALLAEEEAAVAAFPKDAALLERLIRSLNANGSLAKAAKLQEKLQALKPKQTWRRTNLIHLYRSLRNPIAALKVKQAGQQKPSKIHSGATKKPAARATILAVKKALEGGHGAQARMLYRQLWRSFPKGLSKRNNFYTMGLGRVSMGSWSFLWPQAASKEASSKKKATRSRGGLPANLDKDILAEDRARRQKKPPSQEKKRAPEVLVSRSWGPEELALQLRSIPPRAQGSPRAITLLSALEAKAHPKQGPKERVAALLLQEQQGRAGRREYSLLFHILEQSPSTGAGLEDSLAGLLRNMPATDIGQLRRLARLYARLGQEQKAATLYRWCATLQATSAGSYYGAASSLVNDVIKELHGADRDATIQAILDFSRPDQNDYWSTDGYESMVLQTWIRLLGPNGAFKRGRAICDKIGILGQMPRRQTARLAAWLLARAGEIPKALEALEIALCSLTPPDHLRYAWLNSNFKSQGYLSHDDLRRLFPKDFKGFQGPLGWLQAAARKILAWKEGGRIGKNSAFEALGVICLRLAEQGDQQGSRKLFQTLRKMADFRASQLLWVVDIARRSGQTTLADDLELKLLKEGRLNVERVPEVIARVLKKEGSAKALALGQTALTTTLHPKLLDLLIPTAKKAGREKLARHLEQLKQESSKALAALTAKKTS